MDCKEIQIKISIFLDGEPLDEKEIALIESHIAICKKCTQFEKKAKFVDKKFTSQFSHNIKDLNLSPTIGNIVSVKKINKTEVKKLEEHFGTAAFMNSEPIRDNKASHKIIIFFTLVVVVFLFYLFLQNG